MFSYLTSAQSNRTKPIIEAICDRGYRGKKEVLEVQISIPGTVLKRDSIYQKDVKREKFKRRAAIEPIIGHLKSDHRMKKNFLKGFVGDEMNLLLAASAFNLKKWMNNFLRLLFMLKMIQLINYLQHISQEHTVKYQLLGLSVFRLLPKS